MLSDGQKTICMYFENKNTIVFHIVQKLFGTFYFVILKMLFESILKTI